MILNTHTAQKVKKKGYIQAHRAAAARQTHESYLDLDGSIINPDASTGLVQVY
jgi:hypothetical protein